MKHFHVICGFININFIDSIKLEKHSTLPFLTITFKNIASKETLLLKYLVIQKFYMQRTVLISQLLNSLTQFLNQKSICEKNQPDKILAGIGRFLFTL